MAPYCLGVMFCRLRARGRRARLGLFMEGAQGQVCLRVTSRVSVVGGAIVAPLLRLMCFLSSETWVLKEAIIKKLLFFGRKILRRIFGPTK